MSRPRRSAAITAAVVALLLAPLASCANGPAEEIDYAVDGPLTTYNANTVVGAASASSQAFARVLTGFGYHGPEGQIVGDHDFGTVSVVGREPLLLDYTISADAVYSDGKPVTCDDMVLAWAAQSGRLAGFDAASRAGYADIVAVDCVAGQKKASVMFGANRPFTDYMQLFSATSMMPSHVIADQLGVDVTAALQSNEEPTVQRIAEAWNTMWDLKPGIDLRRFPSSGPYKIDSVRADGAVVLVANDRWWGTKPITKRITVWPRSGADLQDRINNGSVDVVDVATGTSGNVTVPDSYQSSDSPSSGVQQLIFSGQGPLAAPPARRALALCTPRDQIAGEARVPIANSRLNAADDDALVAAESTVGGPFVKADPDAAKAALGGAPLTVRIGYLAPNARLATTVGAIARACAPAGITVSEVATDSTGPLTLKNNQIDVLLASTGGATGSGSSGSSAIDAFTLHSGNGNNLSGYSNPQIDGIIDSLAVTSEPKEKARLLADGTPVLWSGMPTLPLYRQQRTLITSKKLYGVISNPTRWGAGWNMDRWVLGQ